MSGFTIPNTPEAPANQNQAEPDSLDFQIIGKHNSGVISGLVVTPTSGTNVAVSAGEVLIEGFYYPFVGITSLALTAYSTVPFFDVVVARLTAGVISCHVVPGSQTTNPRFPNTGTPGSASIIDLSTDVVLASVWRTDTSVSATQIVDKRVIVRSNATRVNTTVLSNAIGAVGDLHVNTSWSADATLKSPVYVKEDSTWYRLARWPEDGNFSAGTITASLAGNASTASKWATTRTLSITGNGTGSTTWDGSGNATLNLTVGYAASAPWDGITGKPTNFVYNNGGTYNINIGGTSAKASTLAQGGGSGTGMTFNWAGQSGQPTWLWGSNDGTNVYVYNPSNFSVNYANSAYIASRATELRSASDAVIYGNSNGWEASGFLSTPTLYANNAEIGLIGSYSAETGGGTPLIRVSNGAIRVTNSRRELKNNIDDYSNGLVILKQLRPRVFKWNDQPTDPAFEKGLHQDYIEHGFVVQEIEEVLADLLHYIPDTDGSRKPVMWKTNDVISILVQAVQELSSRVEALEAL